MTDFNILLEVDSVNISTLAITRHYHSDRHFVSGSGDTPASTQYIPNLDINNVQFYSQSIPVPGAGGPVPITDSPIVFSLARYVGSIDTDRLADYSGEEAEGQYARLIAVGNLPDGATSTLASPRILATGFVSKWLPLQDETIVQITRGQNALGKIIPADTFTGYRDGLWYDGVNDVSSTGVTSFPSSFSIMVRTLIPRGYSGAASFPSCFGNGSVFIGVDHSTPTTPYVGIQYRVSGGAVSAAGPLVVDTEKYYWICMSYSSGVGFTVYLDGESVDVAETTSLDDLSLPWVVGHAGTATPSSYFQGVISCVALFDTDLSNEEIISYQHARLNGDESNLVLFYPGESLSTTLYDYALANDPPADATISGASAVSTGEGDQNVAGSLLPIPIGYCQNVLGIPVDPTTQLYRFAESCQEISEVRDRGAPFTISAWYHSFDSFRLAFPTAGNVVVYPGMGLAKVGGTLSDQAVITADVFGDSLYDYSVALQGATYVSFGTAINSFFLNPFSIMVDFVAKVIDDGTSRPLLDCNDFTKGFSLLIERSVNARYSISFFWEEVGDIIFRSEYTAIPNEPMTIAITVDELAGDVVCKAYKNGTLIGTDTTSSVTLPITASSAPFRMGFDGVSTYMNYASAGRVSVWSKVLSQDEVRQYTMETPDPSTSSLEGLWLGSDTVTTTLPDEVSTNDGTFLGGGPHVWRGGVTYGWPVSSSVLLLNKYADMAIADIEITESAWLAPGRGSAILIDGESTVEEYVALVLASIGGWLVSTPDSKARIGSTRDPDTLTASRTLYAHEIADITRATTNDPEELYTVGYAPIWHVQGGGDLVASVNDTKRSLYSKEVRKFEHRIKSNATRYLPSGRIFNAGGLWSSRQPATQEARRIGGIHGLRPQFFRVTLKHQLSNIFPGDVVAIVHGDIDSSGSNHLVVSVSSTIGDEVGDMLEVWRPNA